MSDEPEIQEGPETREELEARVEKLEQAVAQLTALVAAMFGKTLMAQVQTQVQTQLSDPRTQAAMMQRLLNGAPRR